MSRTDLEQMQHLALAEVGMLLQDDRGKWKLRGETSDHLRAAMMLNGALKAYHSADTGWVACAESYPREGVVVLVSGPHARGHVTAHYRTRAITYLNGPVNTGEWWTHAGPMHVSAFTHWRPLPAPPTAGAPTKPEGAP